MQCLTGAKFTMSARLLRPVSVKGDVSYESVSEGTWEDSQDPITGEIRRVWEPSIIVDDTTTTSIDESAYNLIPCVARGYSTASRFSSSQVFSDTYKNIDVVRMWIPSDVKVEKDDRISHILSADGMELWPDTTFNVTGITPQLGPFNSTTETFLMLERTEV